MRKRFLLFVPMLFLWVTAAAVAQSAGGVDLSWWTIDGGGGRLTGGSLALEGTIGQPEAGRLTAGDLVLYGGFWGPAIQTTPPAPGCPDAYEPNDDYGQATPITPGTVVRAYICTEGEQDYYSFRAAAGQKITVRLSGIPAGHDYDLFLNDPSRTEVAKSTNSGNADERIEYTAQVGGTYYAVVNGYSGHSTTEAYTLRVDLSGGPQYRIYVPMMRKSK